MLEELAPNDARIAHGGLVDGHCVVGEVVGDDEAPTLVLRVRGVLGEIMSTLKNCTQIACKHYINICIWLEPFDFGYS